MTDLPEDEKPTVWATAITGGIDIHCCKCGARMTASAYIIETCQECGAAKQDKRRRLACMRHSRKQGKRLAVEMQRRADDAFIAAHGDKPDPRPIDIYLDELVGRSATAKTKEPEDDGTKS